MALSLFPNNSNANSPAPILAFNAGKCNLQEQPNGSFLVVPDTRRGQISLVKKNDLLHFQWKDRSSGVVDDDRIVFPGDASFKKIETGRSGDRVFIFQLGQQRIIFWMQDKDATKDLENKTKMNDYMNNPSSIPAPAAPAAVGGPNTEALMRLLGLPPSAAARPSASSSLPVQAAPAAATAPAPAFGNLDLSSIIGALSAGVPPAPAQSSAAAAPTPAAAQPPQPAVTAAANTSSSSAPASGGLTLADLQRAMRGVTLPNRSAPLQDILTAEGIINSGALENPEVRARLIAMLPEGQQTEAFLEENLRSPQFRQSVGSLSTALADNFNSVMSNIGVDPAPGMDELVQGDTSGAFLTAMQAAATTTTTAATATASDATAGEAEAQPPAEGNSDRMEE